MRLIYVILHVCECVLDGAEAQANAEGADLEGLNPEDGRLSGPSGLNPVRHQPKTKRYTAHGIRLYPSSSPSSRHTFLR